MQGHHIALRQRIVQCCSDDTECRGLAVTEIGIDDEHTAAEWDEQAHDRPPDISGADDADRSGAEQSLRHRGADVEPFTAVTQSMMQKVNAAHGKQRFGDDELGNRDGNFRGGVADAKAVIEQSRRNELADAACGMSHERKARMTLSQGRIEGQRAPSGEASRGVLQQPVDIGSIDRGAGRPAHLAEAVHLSGRRIVQHHAAGLFCQKDGNDGRLFAHGPTLSLRRRGA